MLTEHLFRLAPVDHMAPAHYSPDLTTIVHSNTHMHRQLIGKITKLLFNTGIQNWADRFIKKMWALILCMLDEDFLTENLLAFLTAAPVEYDFVVPTAFFKPSCFMW